MYIYVWYCYCVVHNNFRAVNIKSTSIVFQWDAPAFVVVSQYSIMCTNMEYSFTVSINKNTLYAHYVYCNCDPKNITHIFSTIVTRVTSSTLIEQSFSCLINI